MSTSKSKLVIRNATPKDIPALLPLYEQAYGVGLGYTADQIAGQINRFPDGQFVAEFEGRRVGAGEERLFDFLGEKAIPTNLSQWAVLDAVAG